MASDTRARRRLSLPWFVWAGGAVALAAVVAFAYWTISPLFVNTRVDEAFPTSAPAAVQPVTAMEQLPTADTMVEVMPTADTVAAPTAETMAEVMPTAEAAVAGEPMADAPAEAAEPVSLGAGSFTDIDRLHGASGTATIYRLPEGGLVLRLEEFNAKNGPDLYVGLSGHAMPRSSDEVHGGGYLELARLKANQGNQNYELPADIDLAQYKSVVIYCKAFSVVFSTATLGS